MSKYYDINKPFSLENWGDLVKDVNDVLQNPPEGTNCQPVETLEEVEEPHIWSTLDVIKMQNQLKKTCPAIDFEVGTPEWIEEHHWKWRNEIVDEMITALNQAWCNCQADLNCGIFYSYGRFIGTAEDECCNIIQERDFPPGGHFYVWDKTQTEYFGEWFPPDETDPAPSGRVAFNAMYQFTSTWNTMVKKSRLIQELQTDIDALVVIIDNDIAYYNANCKESNPPVNCPEYQQNIQEKGELAQEKQENLNSALEIWLEKKALLGSGESETNISAEENWSEWLGIIPRFPESVNLITDCFDPKITDKDDLLNWFLGFNPYLSFLNEIRPRIKVGERWVKFPDDYTPGENTPPEYDGGDDFFCDEPSGGGEPCEMEIGEIHFAPNGTPFSTTLGHFVLSNSCATIFSRFQYRCKCTNGCCERAGSPHTCVGAFNPASGCDVVVPTGEWSEWNAEVPDITEGRNVSQGIRQYKMEISWGSRTGENNTEEREAYLIEFSDWYTNHPEYDNRHENY